MQHRTFLHLGLQHAGPVGPAEVDLVEHREVPALADEKELRKTRLDLPHALYEALKKNDVGVHVSDDPMRSALLGLLEQLIDQGRSYSLRSMSGT